MKLAHKPVLFLLAALATWAVAGCGAGDGDTTTGARATLTKAELIERGDAICAEVNTAVGALAAEAAAAKVPDTIGKSTHLFIEMLDRLQALGPPKDDDGSYAKFMEATEQFAKVETRVKRAIDLYDPVALSKAATEAAPALQEFRSQAAIYGFEDCSKDAAASG